MKLIFNFFIFLVYGVSLSHLEGIHVLLVAEETDVEFSFSGIV